MLPYRDKKKTLHRMFILLNSLLIFIGELLITKVTPEKKLYSEYTDKNRVSIALANTPKLIMCLLNRTYKHISLPVYGSAVGAVCVFYFFNVVFFVFWFNFAFVVLVLSWIFFSNLVFGLRVIYGNRI